MPQNALLVDTDLNMAGYEGDQAAAMQRRMLDTVAAIPGVTAAGLTDRMPLDNENLMNSTLVFKDAAAELKTANAAADTAVQNISPGYFQAAGTTLLWGRTFTLHDDAQAPRVAVVNRIFAQKVFGSMANAMGHYFKMQDGTRIQVVGIVEDGKYKTVAEDPQPAAFRPILQSPSSATWLVVRSNADAHQMAEALDKLAARPRRRIALHHKDVEQGIGRGAVCLAGNHGIAGDPWRARRDACGDGNFWYGILLRRQTAAGIRNSHCPGRAAQRGAAGGTGKGFASIGSGIWCGPATGIHDGKTMAFIAYQGTSGDPLVLAGVVLVMVLLGLLATWIPASRALGADPLMLLREE